MDAGISLNELICYDFFLENDPFMQIPHQPLEHLIPWRFFIDDEETENHQPLPNGPVIDDWEGLTGFFDWEERFVYNWIEIEHVEEEEIIYWDDVMGVHDLNYEEEEEFINWESDFESEDDGYATQIDEL